MKFSILLIGIFCSMSAWSARFETTPVNCRSHKLEFDPKCPWFDWYGMQYRDLTAFTVPTSAGDHIFRIEDSKGHDYTFDLNRCHQAGGRIICDYYVDYSNPDNISFWIKFWDFSNPSIDHLVISIKNQNQLIIAPNGPYPFVYSIK